MPGMRNSRQQIACLKVVPCLIRITDTQTLFDAFMLPLSSISAVAIVIVCRNICVWCWSTWKVATAARCWKTSVDHFHLILQGPYKQATNLKQLFNSLIFPKLLISVPFCPFIVSFICGIYFCWSNCLQCFNTVDWTVNIREWRPSYNIKNHVAAIRERCLGRTLWT